MAKKLENNDQHKSFLEAITAYEQAKLAGHRNCKKPHSLHVTVRQEAQMRTTMCMGYFWPCKVYESHFKKAVGKKRLEVCTHNGVKYKGVFLPPAAGWQPGVIQLDSIGVTGVSKSRELASSDDESDNAETKFASGRKRGALAAKIRPADAKGEESIQVQAVEKKRGKTADSDSDDVFGGIWESVVHNSAGKDHVGEDEEDQAIAQTSTEATGAVVAGKASKVGKPKRPQSEKKQGEPRKAKAGLKREQDREKDLCLSVKEMALLHTATTKAERVVVDANALLVQVGSLDIFQTVSA
jgi:hypothetical protein